MSGYQFRVYSFQTGTYIERFYNDPNGNYWKTVGEAQRIVEAKVPHGARVEYIGQC